MSTPRNVRYAAGDPWTPSTFTPSTDSTPSTDLADLEAFYAWTSQHPHEADVDRLCDETDDRLTRVDVDRRAYLSDESFDLSY